MESKLRLLLQEEAFPDTATAIRLRFDVSTSGSTNGVSLRRDYRFAQPMEGRNREKRFGNNSLPTPFGVINGAETAH